MLLIASVVFVVIMALFLGGYWAFVLRLEERDERALRKRLKVARTAAVGPALLLKAREQLSAVAPLDALLARSRGLIEPLQRTIEQSGLRLTTGAVLLASVFLMLAIGSMVGFVSSSAVMGLVVGGFAATLPTLYVRYAARKRLTAFEDQFPEAIDLIARSLRAGHAMTSALQVVGEEIPDPVGAEFRTLFEHQNYGMSLDAALRAFANRVPLLDARFFVTALLTQREMGGNLSEVLDNLASVIRERFKVKRQVRVVSAHGRITGLVLGVLPPIIAAVLIFVSPEHMRLLIDDPIGQYMVAAGVVLQIVGVIAIKRIVNVEY